MTSFVIETPTETTEVVTTSVVAATEKKPCPCAAIAKNQEPECDNRALGFMLGAAVTFLMVACFFLMISFIRKAIA